MTPLGIDLEALCVPILEAPADLCITLPGGSEVCAQSSELPPSLFAYAKLALGAANSALAPLGPIFTIIETITAIQKCLTAIPGILGPPPNPKKLLDALTELAEKIEKLLKLLPQLSVPLMVVQLIDVIIATIDGAASELNAIARLVARITTAEAMVGQAPGLLSMIECAQTSVDVQLTNIERSFASINPLIELINVLGALAGLKPLPAFGGLPGDPIQAAAALQSAADSLRVVRSAIPV
jgi:hypothetical protein